MSALLVPMHVMGKTAPQACFTQVLSGLASWVCSIGQSGEERKGAKCKYSEGEPTHHLPFDPIAGIRRTTLIVEQALSVSERYELAGTLGRGAYGQVVLARCKCSLKRCAVKCVPTETLERDCPHELDIAWKMVHPYIAEVLEVYQDYSHVRIVMECCEGGTLHNRVKAHKGLPEAVVVKYVWQMLEGIAYLHHHGYAHRDIKPSNYMFQTDGADSPLKLIDMGLAAPVQGGTPLTLHVGTAECSAPEVARGCYDEKCDIWSIGIVTFFCFVGCYPFEGGPAVEVLRKVLHEELHFKNQEWEAVSLPMKAIIRDMLRKDAPSRHTAQELALKYGGWLTTLQPQLRHIQTPVRKRSEETCLFARQVSPDSGSETHSAARVKVQVSPDYGSETPSAARAKAFTALRSPSGDSLATGASVTSKGSTSSNWSIWRSPAGCSRNAQTDQLGVERPKNCTQAKKRLWPMDLLKQVRSPKGIERKKYVKSSKDHVQSSTEVVDSIPSLAGG